MRLLSLARSSVLAAAFLAGASRAPLACPGDGPEGSSRSCLASADAAVRASMTRRDVARFEAADLGEEVRSVEVPASVPAPTPESCAPSFAPGASSMLIELDPESHEWRLRAAPIALEFSPVDDASLDRSFEGLAQEPLPFGGYMVDLRGRFMDHAVVRVGADGRLVYDCVSTTLDAERFVAAPTAAAAKRKP